MSLKIVYGVLLIAAIMSVIGFWIWQRNAFSTGDVKLEILAPQEVVMGEEIGYVVRWKNVGEARLEDLTLVFEYPDGSLPSDQENMRVTKTLDALNPGQEVSVNFKARLFGRKKEVKEARASLSYTPHNLSASFRNETSATTVIAFVPLTFDMDIPSRTEAGQQFSIILNYFSNSAYPLSNLRIQIDYPVGFSFRSADPPPLGENEWDVGLLNRTEGGRITIHGAMEGSVKETKMFRAVIGSWEEGRFTVMGEVTKAVQISKPQLILSQMVNSSPSYAASKGDVLHYEIFFRNPTDRILENLSLLVTFDGRGFDLNSVKLRNGRFQGDRNSIVWEPRDNTRLRFLGIGEEGKVEFWVNVKDDIEIFSPQDKSLILRNEVLISEVSSDFEVKLKADASIEQKGFFADDVFGNDGTHPLKGGQRNTYTIVWQAKNRYADVENVRVRANLPAEVELTGKIFPEASKLTFDSASREIVWEVGDLPAGTGFFEELPSPSVAFQIALTPSAEQRGKPAELIGEARITGEDVFTNQMVSSTDEPIDTTLPDDPSITQEMGIVQ